jgi:hypothetical protein
MAQAMEILIHQNSFNPEADVLEILILAAFEENSPKSMGFSIANTQYAQKFHDFILCLWIFGLLINYNGFKRSQDQ